MSWSIGWDARWQRDIGYGVPAYCDHPECNEEIDRGLAHVCGGEPKGGDHGCGLYFCEKHHRHHHARCNRCRHHKPAYKMIKPEHPRWLQWKLSDQSWAEWRAENPDVVAAMVRDLQTRNLLEFIPAEFASQP